MTLVRTDTCPCQCHGQSALDAVCDIEGGCGHLHQPAPSQTTLGNIGPCVFPHCEDNEGNPRLTSVVVCDSCRRRYRKILDRLAWNYVAIRDMLPKPTGDPDDRPVVIEAREYGHPAEQASDLARKIADQLNDFHDALAELRGDDPPPNPYGREAGRVQAAHHYLTSWLADLCTWPAAADTAEAIVDLEYEARRILGKTNPPKWLTTPCPRCELRYLVRHVDPDRTDMIRCGNCGHRIDEQHYGFLARLALEAALQVDNSQSA